MPEATVTRTPSTLPATNAAAPAFWRALPLSRAQCGLLLAYFAVWALLPVLLVHSFPLDVVEGINWGREWQRGYFKHPPLPPWLLAAAHAALGPVGPFLLGQLCIVLTLAYVWRLGCRLMPAPRAAVGTLLLMGSVYVLWPSLQFNHNLAQLPVWAALAYHALAAAQQQRLRDWLALGAWAGLGLLTKYSVGVMLLVLLLYLLLSPWRRLLRTPGPWVSAATGLAVFAPHGFWLVEHGFLPLRYALHRAPQGDAAGSFRTLKLLGAQLLAHAPMFAIVAATRPWRARADGESRRLGLLCTHPAYLWTIALGPIALVTLLSLATGKELRLMWTQPMWNFSGLLLVALLPGRWLPAASASVVRGVLAWLILATLGMAVYLGAGSALRGKGLRTDWPSRAISAQAHDVWSRQSRCPLAVVAGDDWTAGLIAYRSASPKPAVLDGGNPQLSPWVSVEQLQRQGVLWLWDEQEGRPPEPYGALTELGRLPGMAVTEGRLEFDWPGNARGLPPLTIGWRAHVPAHCAPEFTHSSNPPPRAMP